MKVFEIRVDCSPKKLQEFNDALWELCDGYGLPEPVLQQTPCTALRENIVQLLTEEQQSALRNKRRYLTKVYHNENARALERILKMLDDRQPLA